MNIYLCSGLGGKQASEDTVTIDVDPRTKPDIVADVRHLPLRADLRPDRLIMSPPCTFFTYAQPFPRPGVGQAFATLGACFEAINWLKPKEWILENPRNHLQRILGKPTFGVRWKAGDQPATHFFYSNMKSLKRAEFPKEITQWLTTQDRG